MVCSSIPVVVGVIVEEHVVPAGRGDLAGPLGLDLTNNICQIDKTIRVFAGTLAHDLNGLDGGIGTACRKAINCVIEASPKTSIPSTSSASPA